MKTTSWGSGTQFLWGILLPVSSIPPSFSVFFHRRRRVEARTAGARQRPESRRLASAAYTACRVRLVFSSSQFPTSKSENKPSVPALLQGQGQMSVEGMEGRVEERPAKHRRLPGSHAMVTPDSHH